MDLTAVARSIARLEYAVVRLPFGLLEERVIARCWDEDAPVRAGFEYLLGSLDEFAGRLLDDDEIYRRGQALRRETGSPPPSAGPAGTEAPSPWAEAAASADATADTDAAASAEPPSAPGAAAPPTAASPVAGVPGAPVTSAALPPGTVDVIFTLPADVEAGRVALCGDFNDWSAETITCARAEDGSWQVTVPLERGRSYRYRYLLDGERWENAREADDYVPNPYGGVDSVVVVE